MKLTIINIANKMPKWVLDGCEDYLTRINRGGNSCEIIEIKAEKNPNRSTLQNMEQEAKKILASIPRSSYVIVLDERGKTFNSIKFAEFIEQTTINYPQITFIIGGADGIHPLVKNQAHFMLSLSSLVFPHALVRIIILEQIYRAISILENHPYHRE